MRRLFTNDAAVLPLGLICIVAIILMPLPSWLMDFLLGASLILSLGLLVLSMLVERSLPISMFQSMLVTSTLLRFACGIASTKLILLNAPADPLIEAFGTVVFDGDVIVGLVVIVVITLLQFAVIAKGSERAAEVCARFTLDARPRKPKRIEADLRAGMVTSKTATERRRELDLESQLRRSMDGGLKFFKGDAVVTLLMSFVILLAVGMGSKDLSFGSALAQDAVLSVTYGTLAQCLSLVGLLSAGILMTRVSGAVFARLTMDIRQQILELPMVLLLIGAACLVLAWVPGLPRVQLAGLGALLLAGGWAIDRRVRLVKCRARLAPEADEQKSADITPGCDVPQFAPSLWVALSPSMAGSFDALCASSELLKCRARLFSRFGLSLRPLRVFIDETLAGDCYAIRVHDLSMGSVNIPANCWAIRASLGDERVAELAELQSLGPIAWVPASEVEDATDPKWLSVYALLADHVEAVVMSHAGALVGLEEASRMIDILAREVPELTREALAACPLPRVTEVLRRLADDRVSLRSMQSILESLVKWAPRERDTVLLAEQVRLDLGPSLIQRFVGPDDHIDAVVVDPEFEHDLAASVAQGEQGPVLVLEAAERSGMDRQLRDVVKRHVSAGAELPILVSESIRAGLSALVSRRYPQLCVFSYSELPSSMRIVPLVVLQPAIAN